MLRRLAFVPLAVILVAFFVTGLSALRSWDGHGRAILWSNDPARFGEQVVLVAAAGLFPLLFFVLARFLDPARDNGTHPRYKEKLPEDYVESIKRP